jgi:glutamyl-tRNA synthetase
VLRWQLERDGVAAGDDALLEQIVLSQRERAKTVREMAANSLFFFNAPNSYDEKALRKHVNAEVLALLAALAVEMAQLQDWSAPHIHALISAFSAAKGVSLGKLAQPIRLAVCGGTVSPPIDATLAILGKSETLSRLTRAMGLWSA